MRRYILLTLVSVLVFASLASNVSRAQETAGGVIVYSGDLDFLFDKGYSGSLRLPLKRWTHPYSFELIVSYHRFTGESSHDWVNEIGEIYAHTDTDHTLTYKSVELVFLGEAPFNPFLSCDLYWGIGGGMYGRKFLNEEMHYVNVPGLVQGAYKLEKGYHANISGLYLCLGMKVPLRKDIAVNFRIECRKLNEENLPNWYPARKPADAFYSATASIDFISYIR